MNTEEIQYNKQKTTILDLSPYPKGVYLIRIDYNEKTTYKKIILR